MMEISPVDVTLSAFKMHPTDLFGPRICDILLYGKRKWYLLCEWLTSVCLELTVQYVQSSVAQPAQ
jgi:hypothetical protein